jgi:hypothetical protein
MSEDPVQQPRPAEPWQRVLGWTLGVASLAPGLWPVSLYAFVLRARITTGAWPVHYHPDPRKLGFGVHHFVTGILAVWPLLLGSLLVGLIPLVVVAWRAGRRGYVWWYVVFMFTMAFAYFVGVADPGGYADWFLG